MLPRKAYSGAIDLLESAHRTLHNASKVAQLSPIDKKLTKALGKSFREQGQAFLKGLAKYANEFPTKNEAYSVRRASGLLLLRETLVKGQIDELFKDSEDDTYEVFVGSLDDAISAALLIGAYQLISELGLTISFDLANPRAVTYMQQHGGELIAGINNTTREEIEEILTTGIDEGQSYSEVAQNIVQAYDDMSVVVPGNFTSRAERIAVTEDANAYETGNFIPVQDMMEGGLQMEKSWDTAPELSQNGPCEDCQANEAEGWIPADEEHQSGDMHPTAHTGCLPGDQRVLAYGIQATMKRFYDGEVIIIRTASGNKLTCTPNHLILTPKGWCAANLLNIGSDVICSRVSDFSSLFIKSDNQHTPTEIEKITDAFGSFGNMATTQVPVSAPDFHGDGKGSKVAVIYTHRHLRNRGDTSFFKHNGQSAFVWSNVGNEFFNRFSAFDSLLNRGFSSLCGLVSSFGIAPIFFRSSFAVSDVVGFDYPTKGNAQFNQTITDNASTNSIGFAKINRRFASTVTSRNFTHRKFDAIRKRLRYVMLTTNPSTRKTIPDRTLTHPIFSSEFKLIHSRKVFSDKIISVERSNFSDHVFNLQTEKGFYLAEGIITHNCYCDEYYQIAQ